MNQPQQRDKAREKAIDELSEVIAGIGKMGLTPSGRGRYADDVKPTIARIVDNIIAASQGK